MDELRALMLAEVALTCEERVEISVEIRDLWLIVNALQLAMIHPELHEPLRSWMENVGRRVQAVIVTVIPETEELAEAGWHRENDVATEQDDHGPYPGELEDWDGLRLCENCHDRYTLERLCTSCAEQEQIDRLC